MHTRQFLSTLAIMATCVPAPGTAQRAVYGQWQVTGAKCPTECTLGQAELASWQGRIATYSDTLAGFAGHVCRSPRYAPGFWPGSGLYGGARLVDLGIAGDSVMVVEVRCLAEPQAGADPRWRAPGAFLIVKDSGHLLMVWEGVYFELTHR